MSVRVHRCQEKYTYEYCKYTHTHAHTHTHTHTYIYIYTYTHCIYIIVSFLSKDNLPNYVRR